MNVLGYTESGAIRIEIDGIETFVPDDMGNRHRQMIAEWEAAGNTIPAYEPPPPPVPAEISRRQFYQGLAKAGFVSKAEALAALDGVIPPAIMAVVDAIEDEDAQFDAMAHLKGSLSFMRHHPLVAIFAASQGLSEAEVDEFWQLCAGLL